MAKTIKWLTTGDLEKFINNFASEETKAAFLGVFAINQLPRRIVRLPILFIINTNTLNLPGQHWKAIHVSSNHIGEVFDSLATPISLRLEQWMNAFTKKWTTSQLIIQNPLSPTCGAYVLYYIMTRLKEQTPTFPLINFTNDVVKNDKLVEMFYKRIMKNKA